MITYRKAAPADAQALANLRGIFLMDTGDITSEQARADIEKASLAYFAAALADESFVAWLAMDGEEIVATSGLSFSVVPPFSLCPDGKVAYIMNMFTLPEYRRQGIADALFQHILAQARARGCRKITLHATAQGRPLYEKYGFADVDGDMVLYDA